MTRLKHGAIALGIVALLLVLAHLAMPVDDHSKLDTLSQSYDKLLQREAVRQQEHATLSTQTSQQLHQITHAIDKLSQQMTQLSIEGRASEKESSDKLLQREAVRQQEYATLSTQTSQQLHQITHAIDKLSQQMTERSIEGRASEKESYARRDTSSLHGQAPRCTYPSWLNQVFNPDSGDCPWDGQEVITSSNITQQCLWTAFKDSGKHARMCVHPSDAVSGNVVRFGRWADCDRLAPMWRKQQNPAFGNNQVYLELGGNIGTCLMHMLLLTDARLVVFEPNPKNLFCITSTLLGLNADLRQRVALFPFAVGDQTVNDALINAAVNNLGNSAIGVTVQDGPHQTFFPPEHIQIKALDFLNVVNHLDIPLMKMDVQGFECKALAGMPQTLSKVRSIFTEVARRWLQAQNCTEAELFNILEDTGFSVSARQPKDVYDIQATRPNQT